ncbi:MAG: polysaccharide lyase 6 family protein [Candidatus Sumerlaeota bacterium]|nr:polysaccharide lyase 6 family protein [Candidatus Sumerlaeota bacterium]
MKSFCLLAIALTLFVAQDSFATEATVASAEEVAKAMKSAQPGDTLVMKDGEWKDQTVVFEGKGAEGKPIALRAQTPGKVILCGQSNLRINGSYLVVQGLRFTNGGLSEGSVIQVGSEEIGDHCRVTDCAIVDYNPPSIDERSHWVSLYGNDNRVDHCRFSGKTNSGVTLVVWLQKDKPAGHRIDHNYFGRRPRGDGNGFETIRVGTGNVSMTAAHVVVEYNLFEECDGEMEMVSNKSCENVYRYNTFRKCSGCLTLRQGKRCVVDGNFILAGGKERAGGIRVIDEDHIIVNNYIEGAQTRAGGAIVLTSGVLGDSELKQYSQVKRARIAFNTIVDSLPPYLILDAGMGQDGRSLLPEDVTIANNVFYAPLKAATTAPKKILPMIAGQEGAGFQWMGNIAFGADIGVEKPDGVTVVDPQLARDKDGVWRPSADSPVCGAAQGDFSEVKTDIDGQARTGKYDVGCDQISEAPVQNRPLVASDVGPSWARP